MKQSLLCTLGQISTFYPKIHTLKIPIFTKFTFQKSHFSQNSPFWNLILHKIHIFEISFFTKFTFLKSHFSQNSYFWNIKIKGHTVHGILFDPLMTQMVLATAVKKESGMVNWSNQQVSEFQRARRFTVTMAGKEPEDKLLPTLQPNIAQINLRTISSSCHSSLNKSALDYSRNGLVAYASHGVINILELDPKARIGNVKLWSIWFSFCTLGGVLNCLFTIKARFARNLQKI